MRVVGRQRNLMTGSLQMICQWGTDLTITNECDFHNLDTPYLPNAKRQAPPKAGATQERSNCLGCQGALSIFLTLDRLPLPGHPLLQQGVEAGQKLTHPGRQGNFFALARGPEPLVKGFHRWVKARGYKRAHGQHGAHMRTASPNQPPSTQGPTGTLERRH